MSLAIDLDRVKEVLLTDGEWYTVSDKSFILDSYEFVWWSEYQDKKKDNPTIAHGGGNSNISATGFSFKCRILGTRLAGPLSSIVAVKY